MGALATFLALGPLSGVYLIWAAFIAWGAFYALGGKPFWRSAKDGRARMGPLLAEVMLEPIPSGSARARELEHVGSLPAGFDAWLARCLVRERQARWSNPQGHIAAR